METTKVSKKLLKRLPVYLSYLKLLPDTIVNVSATAIARDLGLGEVQVRKDLAKVSEAGRKRTGRSRKLLIRDIEEYLNFAAQTGAILVGTGKLGRSLLEYDGFGSSGINLMAGFDICPTEDTTSNGKPIYPVSRMESFCRYFHVDVGIIAVPAQNAQEICDCLIACGIRAIWNFAPVQLVVPEHIVVHNENLAVSLTSLCLQIQEKTTSP